MMIYLRLLVVVVLLLGVVYDLYQCSDTSSTEALTALKTELADAKAAANGTAPTSATSAPGKPATTEQLAELKQVIARATNIYVNQDYGGMAGLTDPEVIKSLQPSGPPAMTVPEYARLLSQQSDTQTAIAQTLQALVTILDETPQMNDDGTRAVYKLTRPIGNLTQVVFVKVNGTWYLH